MAHIEQDAEMIKCVHKETGKPKFLPRALFKDPAIAERLDYRPIDIKPFEATVSNDMAEFREQQKEKARLLELELEEKKRKMLEEDSKKIEGEPVDEKPEEGEEVTTDPLGDNRHHLAIISDIKKSNDVVFVSKYLSESRMGVRGAAEKRLAELTNK